MIRYQQENINAEALSKRIWRQDGLKQHPSPHPYADVPTATSKNQRAATVKNYFDLLLNIAVIIISLDCYYYRRHKDFHFTNDIACSHH